MRQSTRPMKSSCLREGISSRGRTWDDRLKCHEAGKRHEKLILSTDKEGKKKKDRLSKAWLKMSEI